MAIQCNAADIHLRSSKSMDLMSTSPLSTSVWINVQNWSAGTRLSFVGIYGGLTDLGLEPPVTAVQIGTSNGAGELSFWTWGGSQLCSTAANFMNIYNNVWVFIAYTFDGTTHRGYLNGVQVCSATTAVAAGYLNQVYINGYPGGGVSEVANHQVDQYSLFRRTLSAPELVTMHNSAGTRHGIVNGLVSRHEFDELGQGAAAVSIPDFSGNLNTLTPVGVGTNMTYTYTNTLANSNIRPVQ